MSSEKDPSGFVPQVGRVEWIGVSPARLAGIEERQEVDVEVGTGIVGDHHATNGQSQREVTLIQHEHLPLIGVLLGRESVDPKITRRNLVVSGINLLALKDRKFRVGEVVLEYTGPCNPCYRMEENLGPGGHAAMCGHGGLLTVVLQGGRIRVGDPVSNIPDDETESNEL